MKKNRNAGLLFTLLLFVIIGCVSTVDAYRLSGVKWPQPSATFYVDIPGADGLWNDAFEGAMNEWSASTIFQFYIIRGTYSDPCDSNDDRNGVRFASTYCGDAWGSTTLAICQYWYQGSTIVEADIVFNSTEDWDVYSGPWQSRANDFRRVAVHELGHALGLNHEDSGIPSIMMSYAGDTSTPQQDDINGVAAIYGSACIYSISPTSGSFSSSGGTSTVSVTVSSSNCYWTTSETLSWVSLSPAGGTGSDNVTVSVSANTGGARSGLVTIAGKTYTISQAALSCTYSIAPTSGSFSSSGGASTVSVTASSSNCSWITSESLSWVSLSPEGGTGSDNVTVSVSANTGSARSGLVTIAGKTYTISQAQADMVEEFVRRFYQVVLDRTPDSQGLEYWTDSLKNGTMTGTDVAEGFIFSPEFMARQFDNPAYVEVLYSAFFNRPPDQGGYSYWLDLLNSGAGRDEVLNGFLGSREFEIFCETYNILATSLNSSKDTDSALSTAASGINPVTEVNTSSSDISCGAYVARKVWKQFDCYNLAAIGKTTGDDPFVPSWRLIGGYWQWGRKGPDSNRWYDTNTPHFAHGPTGPDAGNAGDGAVYGWDQTEANNGAWSDGYKTVNDPCPQGFRAPTQSQWEGMIANNVQSTAGTWSASSTNYGSARFFGNDLMLPAAGYREYHSDASLYHRGSHGFYWSSTEGSDNYAWYLYFPGNWKAGTDDYYRNFGFSVRCIAE